MSTDNDSAAAALLPAEKCCASCGVAEIDDIKLKPCPHCDLVEYCSDECQQEHREKHEVACKERAAELYDEILFKQPESSYLGDCPICFLPMPLDSNKSRMKACCGQIICLGCIHANNLVQGLKENRCPFCRHVAPQTMEGCEKLSMERAELNDPNALRGLGNRNSRKGDHESAFNYWSRAAELGDVDSMFNLYVMHSEEMGVERDRVKERALLEKAAIAGHPGAIHNLGCFEFIKGRFERAVKHWIIAANFGVDDSIKTLTDCYKVGHVSKEDFAAALRAYQSAVNAAKSPQREAAEAFYNLSE